VRVKGGDALLFGRAGEEIDYLRSHGVAVSVISGVTSGSAAAASLTASLTHRDHCHGVTFITAHTSSHGEPDWKALAGAHTTLVIYMGMSRLDAISAGLLAGMPGSTPAAIVQSASCGAERRLVTTLARLAGDAQREGFGSPAVVLVGGAMKHACGEAALLLSEAMPVSA
jgi:uroporphyrin-III C-methyltransferase